MEKEKDTLLLEALTPNQIVWVSRIFEYGILTALYCCEYFESKEEYEECVDIIRAIEYENKITKRSHPTKISEQYVDQVFEELSIIVGKSIVPDNRYLQYATKIIENMVK